jgi:Flp pilus assembly CpaE family ATPase
MPALALIRSGGLLFVRAANEGRTVIEMYPKERITEDFDALAERLVRTFQTVVKPQPTASAKAGGFRLPFGRSKEAARA